MEDICRLSAKILSRLENLLWEKKFTSQRSKLTIFDEKNEADQPDSFNFTIHQYQSERNQNDFSIENEILNRENGMYAFS